MRRQDQTTITIDKATKRELASYFGNRRSWDMFMQDILILIRQDAEEEDEGSPISESQYFGSNNSQSGTGTEAVL